MKRIIIYILIGMWYSFFGCSNQNIKSSKNTNTQKGILMYYMHEPYFFPTTDTSIINIAKANLTGLKLSNIKFNDIYDSISHQNDVVIYAAGDKNEIDTVKSRVGILPVTMKTRPTKTSLSSDTYAFAFAYGIQEWVFKYEIRFDKEVLSISPLFSADKKAFEAYIKRIKSD